MTRTSPSFHPERGGMGFYIILAIAMFGGLTYAVSKGGRFGTKALTTDQARMAAQEIIDYGNTMTSTVQKMRLRGVPEHGFDFSNNVWQLQNSTLHPVANGTCTLDSCRVFNVGGGKMTARYAPENALGTAVTAPGNLRAGAGVIRSIPIQGIGTAAPEMLFEYAFLNDSVCKMINDVMGIPNPGGLSPQENYSFASYSDTLAAFPPAGGPLVIGDEATDLAGKTTFCVHDMVTPGYRFYQVLIAR